MTWIKQGEIFLKIADFVQVDLHLFHILFYRSKQHFAQPKGQSLLRLIRIKTGLAKIIGCFSRV